MTKRCSGCGITKPLGDFYTDNNPRNKTGRQSRCKACAKAQTKQWLAAHPRSPEKERERLRRRRAENPDEDRGYGRRWREKDPQRSTELAKARAERWRREKPWMNVAKEHRRRLKGGGVTREDADYMAILRRDPCSYCGELAGTVDHIVPIDKSGEGSYGNLTSACRSCNCSKGTETLLHFLRRA